MAEKQKTFEMMARVIVPIKEGKTKIEACEDIAKQIKTLGVEIELNLPLDAVAE